MDSSTARANAPACKTATTHRTHTPLHTTPLMFDRLGMPVRVHVAVAKTRTDMEMARPTVR
eukprot:2663540-Alexandrium_andersonii.AAC.1